MGAGHGDQSRHAAERTQVAEQVGAIDAANAMSNMVNSAFGGHVRFFGKTDFEGHRLNTMIDMVDDAKPEHLESAGQALWNARDAISEAAEELNGHIGRVDWTGEAADSFNTWGGKLVTHARQLASFAEVAGTQITAAATGLASVRNSMPPRDTRAVPKTVAEIPHAKRVDSNHEYAAAVKVEDHRQEAINQMNRLSSFYSVSEEALAAQEPPVFEAMPDIGVPKAEASRAPWVDDGSASGSSGSTHISSGTTTHAVTSTTHHLTADPTQPAPHREGSVSVPSRHDSVGSVVAPPPGTEIDSVGTMPATSVPSVSVPPVTTAPTGTVAAPGGSATGFVAPTFGGAVGRTPGASGTGSSFATRGRVTGTGSAVTGRSPSGGTVGRAGAAGQSSARGTTGAARGNSTSSGRTPAGRGISGGTPRAAGTSAKGATGRGGARGPLRAGNGVVGGKPKSTSSGTSGSRVPRGNVVGAERQTGAARENPSKLGRRGVVGAAESPEEARSGQARRPNSANSDGVVGTPKGRNQPGAQSGTGMRGAGSKGKPRRLGRKKRDDDTKRGQERGAPGQAAEEHERGPAEG